MKKGIVITLCIIVVILTVSFITKYVDGARVSTNNEPVCCIKLVSKDECKITYWGLGYKVVRYVGVSPNEPYQNNVGVKMGGWFMKYELPIDTDGPITDIKRINEFYNLEITVGKDIRNLTSDYSLEDAEKDGYLTLSGARIYNDNLYTEFNQSVKNNKTAFIRVAQTTVEGDLILTDVLYYENSRKVYLVLDTTRDYFGPAEITLKSFQSTAEYEYKGNLYWVAYNGELNDIAFTDGSVFVIAQIN